MPCAANMLPAGPGVAPDITELQQSIGNEVPGRTERLLLRNKPAPCGECGAPACVKQRGDKFVVVCRFPGEQACCETLKCGTEAEAEAAWTEMNALRIGG